MPYRIKNGVIECDTVAEVKALMGTGNGATRRRTRAQKAAVSESWKKAKALAKKEGITVFQARSKLAKASK